MGHWETGWSRDVLLRIVTLLFSLADLADLAAHAPRARRRRVLDILNLAEAEALAFLTGARVPGRLDTREAEGEAQRLAARFRALALLLCALLAERHDRAGTAGPRGGQGKPIRRAFREASAAAPDTS